MKTNVDAIAQKVNNLVTSVMAVYLASGGDEETSLGFVASKVKKEFGLDLRNPDGSFVSVDVAILYCLEAYRDLLMEVYMDKLGESIGLTHNDDEETDEEPKGDFDEEPSKKEIPQDKASWLKELDSIINKAKENEGKDDKGKGGTLN